MGSLVRAVVYLLSIFTVVSVSTQATSGQSSYRVVETERNETLLCIVSFGTALNKESEVIFKTEAEIALVNRETPSESRIDLFSFPLNELDDFAKKAREKKDPLLGEMLQYRLEMLEKYLLVCAKSIPFDSDTQQAIEILKRGMRE